MAAVNAYLNFMGNTEEAFHFYRSVFGGEFGFLQRFKDTPHCSQMPDAEKEKIMHISLPIGKNMMLMATDVLESMGKSLVAGNNFSLCISTASEEETDKYFALLGAGGKISMPLEKMFWGAYFGMLTDKFGVQWMLSYDPKFPQ